MYKIIIKGQKFTIPKKNIRFLAMVKAKDLNLHPILDTEYDAVKFLESLGCEVK